MSVDIFKQCLQVSPIITQYCQILPSMPIITNYCKASSSTTKYHQASPSTAKYHQILPSIAKCCQEQSLVSTGITKLGSITKYFKAQRLLSPSIAKNCQILSRAESSAHKYDQVLPSITKYYQVSLSISKYRQVLPRVESSVPCPLHLPRVGVPRGGRFQLSHTNHPPTNSYKTRTQLFSTQVHDIQVCPRLFLSS